MNYEMNVRGLKALGDPTRLHIVEFLSGCCCGRAALQDDGGVEGPTAGEVCCHITGAEKITSTISHHLHELEDAGIVRLSKRGKATVCTLEPSRLIELSNHLLRLAESKGPGCC